MLDKFEVVLHSPDQIAPVGVLHPLEFHLEKKLVSLLASDIENSNEATVGESDSVCEVLGDCSDIWEAPDLKNDIISGRLDTKQELHIAKSKKNSNFSIACWLQDASRTSTGITLSHDGNILSLKYIFTHMHMFSSLLWMRYILLEVHII